MSKEEDKIKHSKRLHQEETAIKPIYEYRWSNAEPRQPAQNEEGFI